MYRTKPSIGRSQKLALLLIVSVLGNKCGTVINKHIAMDEIVGRVADEDIAAICFRKTVGGVDKGTTGRGDISSGHQLRSRELARIVTTLAFLTARGAFDAPCLKRTDAMHLASGAVVGNVQRDGADCQGWIAAQIRIG